MTDETAPDRPTGDDSGPQPQDRRHADHAGVPAKLAGGHTWLLPHAAVGRGMDAFRDAVFDEITARSQTLYHHIAGAAYYLLRHAYRLTPDEAAALVARPEAEADREELIEAVITALLGSDEPDRTYSQWARAALLSNSIDPATLPPEAAADVLRMLVATNRAAGPEAFVATADWRARRNAVLAG